MAIHGFLTFLFLINGYWLPLILNLPLLGWNVKKYVVWSLETSRIISPQEWGNKLLRAPADYGRNTESLITRTCWTPLRSSASSMCTRRYHCPDPLVGPQFSKANTPFSTGILHQARLPPHHVLLLPVQHDCRPHPRRGPLSVHMDHPFLIVSGAGIGRYCPGLCRHGCMIPWRRPYLGPLCESTGDKAVVAM